MNKWYRNALIWRDPKYGDDSYQEGFFCLTSPDSVPLKGIYLRICVSSDGEGASCSLTDRVTYYYELYNEFTPATEAEVQKHIALWKTHQIGDILQEILEG